MFMCGCMLTALSRPAHVLCLARAAGQQVSSQVSFCLKELLKKHPGMKGPVVKETASDSVASSQWSE